jgi:hypothetical protein
MSNARSLVLAVFTASALSGCTSGPVWQNRYGPDPIIAASDVQAFSRRQQDVLNAFVASSPEGLYDADSIDYYEVVQSGFNYVDEKCDNYLRSLFILDRRRDRVRGGFLLLDKSTTAILNAASASQQAIVIVAQAFGLAAGFTDIFANSYLYNEPSILFSTVDKMRHAYREQAAEEEAEIVTAAAAYGRIRGYLALCMPQTIEAKISETISAATATTEKKSDSAAGGATGSAAAPQGAATGAGGGESRTDGEVPPRVRLQ